MWTECPDCKGEGAMHPIQGKVLSSNLSWAELVNMPPATCATCEGEGQVKEQATNKEWAEMEDTKPDHWEP